MCYRLFLLVVISAIISCNQNKAKSHQEAVKDMMEKYGDDKSKTDQPVDAKAPSSADASSPLMGEWKCVLVTGDNNSNGILDEPEKASGFTTYNDYLRLNPDGSCEYTVAHMTGAYEIVEKDGNKSIEVIVRDGSRIKYGRIISLKPDELQLMKFSGGRDIIVYNRP